jgi:glycoside/pentoside/hexuronide:cation symporter, GPH family
LSTPGSAPAPAARLPAGANAAYAVGAVAYGVKDAGFGTFLLLFYNQTVGLPPSAVGLVIMLALLVDAVIDPAIGYLSDRTRGRWGRRHPWMYASAAPIAVGWLLLWHPPTWGEGATLGWLFATAVAVRTAVSAYEVPAAALTPELSSDYDERTRITAWRYLFGWAGGLLMLLAAYLVFLAPNPATASRAAFGAMATLAAGVMAVAILVSAAGTHRRIPLLPRANVAPATLRASFAELFQTVRNPAYLVLLTAGVAAYTNQGISYALSNYLYGFVWGLRGLTFVWITLALFAGVVGAFLLASGNGRGGNKKGWAAVCVMVGAAFQTAPYWLRLAGMMPDPGSSALLPLLLGVWTLATAGNVTALILAASMGADVVEHSQDRTGRRSEGVFAAGWFFVQKCTSGIGIFLAGTILAVAGFPDGATPGQVPAATLDRLTLIYGGLYLALACLCAGLLLRFPFGRAEHEARLARLSATAAAAAATDAAPHLP